MSDPVKPPSPPPIPDPAAIWWGSSTGQPQQPGYRMPMASAPVTPLKERWEWRYSRWTGIMYGPIPVGLLIGLPILFALMR